MTLAPDELVLSLEGLSLGSLFGHRYVRVRVRNTDSTMCTFLALFTFLGG